MTRLNYSNLPPEAQQAIQKLTGYTHNELEGEITDYGMVKKVELRKAKPFSFKDTLYQIAVPLVALLLLLAIVFLIATIATHC